MKRSERRKIYSTFREIIRVTALSSPTTSLSEKQLQELLTKNLKGEPARIDFGILRLWDDIFTSEDDPNINEIVFPDIPTAPSP